MFQKEIFASRIHELRTENHLTQQQFGDLFGVTHKTICAMEKGERLTSIEKLAAIAEYFHVTTDWLLGLSDQHTR